MQKKLLLVCSVLYLLMEALLLVVGIATNNQKSLAFVLGVFAAICFFGISLFFPIRFNILMRYGCLFVLWGIHMAIVMGTNLWDNSSFASVFMGVFAHHFILTIASVMPTERLNLNKYLFFTELLICFISIIIFPLSIPMLIFKEEGTQLMVVGVLGSLTFMGEIGIALFKHFKIEK